LHDRSGRMCALTQKTIADAFISRENRLTPIRLALATAVLIEHAIIVTQGPLPPPPLAINGWSLSYAAVNAFFVLSGFLIADSLERRGDAAQFAAARMLRLWPALIVLSLGAVFAVGPVVTGLTVEAYFLDPQTWLYPINVMFFLDTSQGPVGIFPDNAWAGEFSATLWTLRYEVIAYAAAAILFFSPWPWGRWSHVFLFGFTVGAHIVISLFWPDAPAIIASAARLSAAFTLGMVFHGWRHRISILPWPALIAVPLWLALGESAFAEVFMNIAIASLIFAVAFAGLERWPVGAKIPDWSYGIYIWHYPIMQIVLWIRPQASPLEIGIASLPVTLLVAAASWSWVERPSLSLKSRLGAWLGALDSGRGQPR
jgi:peptidoglycan/LPS O-acetylase OafA/YrhL